MASIMFSLSETQKESLLNRAGLSFYYDKNFAQYFQNILDTSDKFYRDIYEEAQVSERMFRYIKSGSILTKETLLALAISLGMNIDQIEILLQKAGYVLSKSIAFDMVVKWLIENDERKTKEQSLIMYINFVLDELELPLLMTREKREKSHN